MNNKRSGHSMLRWAVMAALGFGGLGAGQLCAQMPAMLAEATSADPIAPQAEPPTPPQPGTAGDLAVKDDLFAGTEKFAKGASEVTEVSMDPDSLEMVKGSDARRAHRMLLNVVRTYSFDKPGMYNPADVEEFRKRLETGDWHCSIHTRDSKHGEATDICSKRRAPDILETAIITEEPKELTFIHTIRRISPGDSSITGGAFEGSSALAYLGGGAGMAVLQPGLDAELAANAARMQAETAELKASLEPLQAELRDQMGGQLKAFDRDELQRQMQALRDQLEHLKSNALNGPDLDKQMQSLRDALQRRQP